MTPKLIQYAESASFLFSQIGAQIAELFGTELSKIGVTPRGFGVMTNLQVSGSLTQQHLADNLGIHRNNMVGLIDELEALGWVRRNRSSADRRAFDIQLTRQGSETVDRALRLVAELERHVTEGLTRTEADLLIQLLRTVAHSLDLAPGIHPHLKAARRT
ncbi:MarR family transcriptional regulator [Paenarthrobacter sp. PH39-S1]|uniref:MarR family winged helix-turn-helix transcriptional regulator n=1 Tax=Paenarthrobacter sp. PH39-S1 TaxID=3046204 RepID=UPI0024B91D5B|nr:MarR family transcriptional regulator [Paenarthrobacter sp. PH39-S1]MDJ0356308.1 MarR family transcriptional regulator [Paenarthrobacter sp. PH39-S1]